MPVSLAASCVPVVAVDVIQPAALLDDLHGSRDILPRGEAMSPLVFLAIAGLDATAVGALLFPAGVVVGALLRLRASQDGTWRGRRQDPLLFFVFEFEGVSLLRQHQCIVDFSCGRYRLKITITLSNILPTFEFENLQGTVAARRKSYFPSLSLTENII